MPSLGRPSTPIAHTPGVNLAGYFDSPLGLGRVARLVRDALGAAGVPVATVTLPDRRRPLPRPTPPEEPQHAVNVICANAEGMEGARAWLGPRYLDRPTAAVWWWELERFPARWRRAFDGVDEVWAFSEFVADAIRPEAPVPVRALPLPMEAVPAADASRAALGLPAGFMFLNVFDFASGFARKNPLGAVEAFARAFPAGESTATLVIKHIGGEDRPEDLDRLERAAQGHDGVRLVGGEWPAERMRELMATTDCYLSLHRSEGFGLPLAEAAIGGTPVVATAYSGPLDFLDSESAFLVEWSHVPVGPGNEPYEPEARWAEPDLDDAARRMREVCGDPGAAKARAARAQALVAQEHAPAQVGRVLAERLEELASHPARLAPGAPELDALERLIRVSTPESAPGRSRARRGLRRSLLRLLRPMSAHQARVDLALLAQLRTLEERVRELERRPTEPPAGCDSIAHDE